MREAGAAWVVIILSASVAGLLSVAVYMMGGDDTVYCERVGGNMVACSQSPVSVVPAK